MFKIIGIASILVLWVGLGFLVWFWRNEKHREMTFSQHAAQTRVSQIYYFLLFALMIPPFLYFVFNWVTPMFQLSMWFNIITVIGGIFQMVAVSVPETSGWRVPVHRNAAFMMAICMPVALTILLFSPVASIFIKLLAAAAIIMQLTIIYLFIPNRGYHPRVQILQAVYIAVYHAAIIVAALSV